MTLAPVHSTIVRGVKGPPGELGPTCSAPGCISNTQQRHHLWPKSYLRGQPYEWVFTPWGKIVQNSTGLCVRHHSMVTGEPGGHKAAIMVDGDLFVWAERAKSTPFPETHYDTGWEIKGNLWPQPPVFEVEDKEHEHQELAEGETCPVCGHQKPRASTPRPRRPSKSWTISVPADAELGTDVLDGWVEDFASLFGFEDGTSRLKRYHVLAVLLAWASQHKPQLIKDIVESQK